MARRKDARSWQNYNLSIRATQPRKQLLRACTYKNNRTRQERRELALLFVFLSPFPFAIRGRIERPCTLVPLNSVQASLSHLPSFGWSSSLSPPTGRILPIRMINPTDELVLTSEAAARFATPIPVLPR